MDIIHQHYSIPTPPSSLDGSPPVEKPGYEAEIISPAVTAENAYESSVDFENNVADQPLEAQNQPLIEPVEPSVHLQKSPIKSKKPKYPGAVVISHRWPNGKFKPWRFEISLNKDKSDRFWTSEGNLDPELVKRYKEPVRGVQRRGGCTLNPKPDLD